MSSERDNALVSLHLKTALDRGLELFSYSQASICESLKPVFQEQVVTAAAEFALHARRVCEMHDLLNKPAPLLSFGFLEGGEIDQLVVEKDFFSSLNRIVHARSMTVKYVIHPEQIIFRDEPNYVLSYLEIKTDRRSEEHVSIFGISAHFLTRIAPVITRLLMPKVNSTTEVGAAL